MSIDVRRAEMRDIDVVVTMVGELLHEIMHAVDRVEFHFDRDDARTQLAQILDDGRYFVLVAVAAATGPVGFVSMYEGFALYTEGRFGTMSEFYVLPEHRSQGVGRRLADAAKAFAAARGWRRLEVTTPPLPAFERTLAFYEREGFATTGGRKLKFLL
ncbi:MAG: GNAT family N-acetyltransferase [Gammaproteobacteria bacterium]|nr:GNAT family N-acetyltransferase [Gammaproteobacteria bacterium]